MSKRGAGAPGISSPTRLLDTAAALFRANGFPGTSIRDISAEMGWTSASIYHHVASKSELLYQISRSALDELYSPVESVLYGTGSPVDRLRSIILVHCTIVFNRTDYHAAMLFELRHLKNDHLVEIQRMRDRYEKLLEQVLEQARNSGELLTNLPLKFQRLTLLNLLNWPLIWFREGGEFTPVLMGTGLAETFLKGNMNRAV